MKKNEEKWKKSVDLMILDILQSNELKASNRIGMLLSFMMGSTWQYHTNREISSWLGVEWASINRKNEFLSISELGKEKEKSEVACLSWSETPNWSAFFPILISLSLFLCNTFRKSDHPGEWFRQSNKRPKPPPESNSSLENTESALKRNLEKFVMKYWWVWNWNELNWLELSCTHCVCSS